MEKPELVLDAEACRSKARGVLAKAEAAADPFIAVELRILAERYLVRAFELEAPGRRRVRRTRFTPRLRALRAGLPPSCGADRGDI